MPNAVEVAEQRMQLRQTRALVHRYGVDIVLERGGDWQDDGEGGRVPAGPRLPTPAQRLFFSGLTGRGYTFVVSSSTGDLLVTEYVLIGNVGADIEKGDEFTLGGRRFMVHYVYPDTTYQVKADVRAVEGGQ